MYIFFMSEPEPDGQVEHDAKQFQIKQEMTKPTPCELAGVNVVSAIQCHQNALDHSLSCFCVVTVKIFHTG